MKVKVMCKKVGPQISLFAALLIIDMLMNCLFNQINGAFHNYLFLYIGVTTRATNKQYALQKSCYRLIYTIQCLFAIVILAYVNLRGKILVHGPLHGKYCKHLNELHTATCKLWRVNGT